ncbi:unnamed protein product [Symbiodinium necroappetens]|uniref:Uncharacterized protein n=1 Tax=Symbiodinium necroappetens TaxID=1628268 RepID=A0A812W185_9DINO|nr:unnamed protein product [Symbiodinium necroappetens]
MISQHVCGDSTPLIWRMWTVAWGWFEEDSFGPDFPLVRSLEHVRRNIRNQGTTNMLAECLNEGDEQNELSRRLDYKELKQVGNNGFGGDASRLLAERHD